MRRIPRAAAILLAGSLLAGCSGNTTPASNITASSAQLNATASCTATCSWYFRYRVTGTEDWKRATIRSATGPHSNVPISETVSNLKPGEDYEYDLCGKGDQIKSFTCVGLPSRKRTSFTIPGDGNSTIESQVVVEVNRYRAAAGVRPVRFDATLDQAAESTPNYLSGANSYMDPCREFENVAAIEGPGTAAQLVRRYADSIDGGKCRLLHPQNARIGVASFTRRDGTRRWVLYLADEMVAVA